MKTHKNQPISVTKMSFGPDMRAYPSRIVIEGETYEFVDRGLSCTIKQGSARTHILTLTDGNRQFWLREGVRGAWTLLDVQ